MSLHFRHILGLAFAILALVGCGERLPTYRYKITVEVETPEGLRTGSAVREVRSGCGPTPSAVRASLRMRGEAVAIDLPNGEQLFGLLIGGASAENLASITLSPQIVGQRKFTESCEQFDFTVKALAASRLSGVVSPEDYPMFVRFLDIGDPMSVEAVDPENLAAAFGEGYRIERITVNTTNEPVSDGIGDRLPWLAEIGGRYLHGESISRGAPLGLHGGNFRMEE